MRSVFAAVGAEYRAEPRWRGGEIDRRFDDAHAQLVGVTASLLRRRGWVVAIEATYARYGERGSIDILAWQPIWSALLVLEVKSSLSSVEELLRRLDAKVRLAPAIAGGLWEVQTSGASRLVILPATRTERRRVQRHDAVLEALCPSEVGPSGRGFARLKDS